MSVRAYDPTLGRFISRDPLGRAPLMGWTTQPYAYAGNNPLLNVDPSGQRLAAEAGADPLTVLHIQRRAVARITYRRGGFNCRVDPFHDKCGLKWGPWYNHALGVRANALQGIRQNAGIALVFAIVADIGILIASFASHIEIAPLLTKVIAGLDVAVDLFGYLSSAWPDKQSLFRSIGSALLTALAGAHALLSLLTGVASWLLWTLSGAIEVFKDLAAGLLSLAVSLLLSAVASGLEAASEGLAAWALIQFRNADTQEHMNIWDWCAGPWSSGKCGQEPPYIF